VAEAEFAHAIEWYENEQDGLGLRFAHEVKSILGEIGKRPDQFGFADRDIREAKVKDFPYVVYDLITGRRIDVLAVFHQSRDPDEWRKRR
jgi:hypothetical protein